MLNVSYPKGGQVLFFFFTSHPVLPPSLGHSPLFSSGSCNERLVGGRGAGVAVPSASFPPREVSRAWKLRARGVGSARPWRRERSAGARRLAPSSVRTGPSEGEGLGRRQTAAQPPAGAGGLNINWVGAGGDAAPGRRRRGPCGAQPGGGGALPQGAGQARGSSEASVSL